MNKNHIIKEIKRTAEQNGGLPLGKDRFAAETGIQFSDWYGKFWARWGDALIESGYSPNKLQGAYADEWVIEQLIALIRELERYPVAGELRMKAKQDKEFPSHNVFNRVGKKAELASKVIEYCKARDGFNDVIEICKPIAMAENRKTGDSAQEFSALGFVYLMKSGRYYKIGKSSYVERRNYEIGIKLPEDLEVIHKIKTDDPAGIESYWHSRFKDKRKKGEWFELSSSDVKAFKKWKRIA
jgi:hypothetical protein